MVDIYFLVWSLSRLLCCVGSGFNVAAALGIFLEELRKAMIAAV